MNAIDTMIQGYEAARVEKQVEHERTVKERLAAAEAAARELLPEVFGPIWGELEPYVRVEQVKLDQAAFRVAAAPLEIADFLVICQPAREADGYWKFSGIADTDWTWKLYDGIDMLLACKRREYKDKRKKLLLWDLSCAETIEQANQAASLLLLHEPEGEAAWLKMKDDRLQEIAKEAAHAIRRLEAMSEYEMAFRAYKVREAEVEAHNLEIAERVQAVVDIVQVVHELEYGISIHEGLEVTVDTEWVTDEMPEDGWWTLVNGTKKKVFFPVALGEGRKVKPSDRVYGCYDIYRWNDQAIYHWPGVNVAEIMEREQTWTQPKLPSDPGEISWGDIEQIRRKVIRHLVAGGIIKGDELPF